MKVPSLLSLAYDDQNLCFLILFMSFQFLHFADLWPEVKLDALTVKLIDQCGGLPYINRVVFIPYKMQ
jgi:hypothetical protein